ncbi:TPA: ImmA/IrrE family metallo-endopeptidase, partial [Enterococcus faecium]
MTAQDMDGIMYEMHKAYFKYREQEREKNRILNLQNPVPFTMPSSKGEHIMDSILIYQAANDLVQNTGTRNIKRIARSCSLDILETPRFKDVLGFLSLHFDKPLILINSHLDSQTKQMVCGYALGHYLEHQILMDLHTLNKSLAITDKEICLYEPNAFASHLMLDSEEVYQMTKRKMDAAQIADAKRIHINLVLVKLLELHHLGYDLRHYHAQHHAFIKQLNLPEY